MVKEIISTFLLKQQHSQILLIDFNMMSVLISTRDCPRGIDRISNKHTNTAIVLLKF